MKREDMIAAAKFRAKCTTCGERQPRATTAYTVEQWMRRHEQTHRATTHQPEPRATEADEESADA